jgi:MFS family permease
MQMGNTLQATLLSVRGGIEGFSPAQIGAVGAGFWVGVVIGSLRCGKLIQSVGHIRAFLALGAIASTAPLLHLLLMDPIAWVVARALTGFCFAGLFIVVESWLNSAATDETRGQILSIYAMTGLLAGIVGQLLLPATDPAGFRGFCVIAIIIAFALVPIALTRASAPTYEGGGAPESASGVCIGNRRSASWPPSCAGLPQARSLPWGRSSRKDGISIHAELRCSWRAEPWADS